MTALKNYFILALFFVLGEAAHGENGTDPYCWLDGRDGDFGVSFYTSVRSYLIGKDYDDVKRNVKKRVAIGDRRFIAVGGFGMYFPGLNSKEYYEVICRNGWKYFSGASDHYKSFEEEEKGEKLVKYAKSYNQKLLKILQK